MVDQKKAVTFIKEHKELLAGVGIFIICCFLYFSYIDSYPLIDIDETRYVSIARNMFLTNNLFDLTLNGSYFFEKPPLYFWLLNISFTLFKGVSIIAARLPVAACAIFGVFLVYIFARKIVSRRYAVISSLILATSFMYMLLGRIAILDMVLSVCIAFSVYCGFYTLFCAEKHKKYFWWLAYLFSAYAVMAKGIPGVAIPAMSIFFAYLAGRRVNELFKPVYILPGLIIFLLITLPWHIVMLKMHNPLFYNEYIIKHHVARFLGSDTLGRREPWYFLILIFLGGFIPWIFSFFAQIITFLKKSFKEIPNYFVNFNDYNFPQKFLILNVIFFLTVFLFFSAASTKLPTYILPAFFPASFILGKFWLDYINEGKNKLAINVSMYIWTAALALGIIATFFVPQYFKGESLVYIKHMHVWFVLLFALVIALQVYSYIKHNKKILFSSLVVLMTGFALIASAYMFNFVCSFGQNELIRYSMQANRDNAALATYGFGNKYSVLYYYEYDFVSAKDDLAPVLKLSKENPVVYVIVKNKKLSDLKDVNYKIIQKGERYSLLTDLKKK